MESLLAISCYQIKLLIAAVGYIQLSCRANVFHVNHRTTQAVVKTIGCSPQTNNEAPLLKTTSTHRIEHGEAKLFPT